MPCYGETVCILCKCGISESLKDFQRPGLSVPPSRRDVGAQTASDLPPWIYEGTMYIGEDTEEGVRCLAKDVSGLQGRWIGTDGKEYDYSHVHWRCWKMAEEREEDILKATKEPTLAKGLLKLINAFGWSSACPEDPSYAPDSDVLQTWEDGVGCYNVCSHRVTKAILPYATYSRYMGQGCDWVSFFADGHRPPSDDDVRNLITLMLTLRDWDVGRAYDESHDSWECVFCTERRTNGECVLIDQRYQGPKSQLDSDAFDGKILEALGEEKAKMPDLDIDDYVDSEDDDETYKEGMRRYDEEYKSMFDAWEKQQDAIRNHSLDKQLGDEVEAKEKIYQEELEARSQIEEAKRHDAWLDLCRRKREGEDVKASDIPDVYVSNF